MCVVSDPCPRPIPSSQTSNVLITPITENNDMHFFSTLDRRLIPVFYGTVISRKGLRTSLRLAW